jgi:hypothetical protein
VPGVSRGGVSESLGSGVGEWFHRTIVESGRLPLFCAFVAVLVAFLFIRFSVRMIRAQVKWWPGNVQPGGVHIHHVVFGVVFMIIGGVGGIALPDRALWPLCITSAIFGIGVALVLDEFALILHLEDVYWSRAGRTSVDAIFVAVAMIGILVVGGRPFDIGSNSTPGVAGIVTTVIVAAFYVGLTGITLLKGKIWTGLIGVFIPILLIVGALRVARPHSPWARRRYHPHRRRGKARLARAQRRERRYREPLIRAKIWLQEAVAGRPSVPVGVLVDSHAAAPEPPQRLSETPAALSAAAPPAPSADAAGPPSAAAGQRPATRVAERDGYLTVDVSASWPADIMRPPTDDHWDASAASVERDLTAGDRDLLGR